MLRFVPRVVLEHLDSTVGGSPEIQPKAMYSTRAHSKKAETSTDDNTNEIIAVSEGDGIGSSGSKSKDKSLRIRAVVDDDRPETPEINLEPEDEVDDERVVLAQQAETLIVEDGCPMWREEPMDMREIIDLLLADEDAYEEGCYCVRVPSICPGKSATFLVDTTALDHIGDISVDSYGSWSKSIGARSHYFQRLEDGTLKRIDMGRAARPDGQMMPWDLRVTENRYAHPATEQKFRKWTYVVRDANGTPLRWAAIVYRWYCEPFPFKPLPHGNSRRPELRSKPYHRTKPSTFQKMKQSMAMAAGEDGAAITSIIMQNTMDGDSPKSLKQVRDLAWRSGIPFRLRSGEEAGFSGRMSERSSSSSYKRPRFGAGSSSTPAGRSYEPSYYYEEIPAIAGEDPLVGLKRRLIEKQIENEEIKSVVMQNTLELLGRLKKCEFLPMAVVPQENADAGVMVQDNAMEYM